MLTADQLQDVHGRTIVDRDGEELGEVEGVFAGVSGEEVGWLTVSTGLLGRKTHFIPVDGVDEADGALRLKWDKDTVKDSPKVDEELTADDEQALRQHYQSGSGAASPAAADAAADAAGDGSHSGDAAEARDSADAALADPSGDGTAPVQPDDAPITHPEDDPIRDPEKGDRRDAGEMVRPEIVEGIRPKDSDDIDSSKEKLGNEEV